MALRQVRNYKDDGFLRKKSKLVERVDKRILTLIDDMVETMYFSNGCGLAAPQVGILKRVIVVDVGEGVIKLINPELVKAEGELQDTEGCLSVPGVMGEVKRPQKVIVRGLNENSENVEIEGSGLLARAFCHEIDHLDGILFIDKTVYDDKKNENLAEYKSPVIVPKNEFTARYGEVVRKNKI